MRSLRARLFVSILGAVLVAVGVSLALGTVLTRSAVRDTIQADVEAQADSFAGAPPRGGDKPPPGAPPPDARPVVVVSMAEAAQLLPADAVAALRDDEPADGTATIRGVDSIYAARPVDGSVVLVTRRDVVTGEDFRSYLSSLLIASGVGALLAAAAAALLARRMTQPLRRLGGAAGELAAGRSPEPVPAEGIDELDELADSFNEMAEQLALAHDAERAVLLSVSHDLRTPLTSIRGYAEGIEDGTVEPREAAAVVGREAGRLERLVGDLLALARLRQGVLEVGREPVDLAAVGREAEERLRPRAAEAGVEVRVEGESAMVTADHGRVLQVVSNLLDNAIRASPRGETVTIAVGAGELSVADRGEGIPEAEIPRAFERFYLRARAGGGSSEGAGLGLAIVRELTEAMGGSAAVENRPGGGARFTIRLPA